MRARNYYAHPNIRDLWALRCMNRCSDWVVCLKRSLQCLRPQASLVVIYRPNLAGMKGRVDLAQQPSASSGAIQEHVAPSLEVPVSSRTLRRCLAEGHLGSRRPLRVLPLTPTHRRLRLEWFHARGNWTAAE
ncbi:HTH_Tnp_Tc3_2 domain-containing protein [Trichonephila clavipes]|nr:HTH_Tnp_Tc3_2 domain-containing protein [Trichonephila clavipes]